MGDTLMQILDETTALTTDVDLFYLEMPIGKIGLWVMETQTPSRFNGVNVQEFAAYYRGKTKASAIANTKYLKDKIDEISTEVCELIDGTTFKLEILYGWDYLEKDSEGFYVFANRLRLYL